MTDITTIVEIALSLIFAICMLIVTSTVIPAIKAKVTDVEWSNLVKHAKIWVKAAEMIYTGSGFGDKKRDMVISRLQEYCNEHGYSFEEDSIRAALESSVMDMKAEISSKVGDLE